MKNVLLLCNSLELDCFIGVLPSTSRAATVKVLLNVMPTEAADLVKKSSHGVHKGYAMMYTWYPQTHGLKLRSEISISSRQRGHSASSYDDRGDHLRCERVHGMTYYVVVAPVRVLYTCQDMGL